MFKFSLYISWTNIYWLILSFLNILAKWMLTVYIQFVEVIGVKKMICRQNVCVVLSSSGMHQSLTNQSKFIYLQRQVVVNKLNCSNKTTLDSKRMRMKSSSDCKTELEYYIFLSRRSRRKQISLEWRMLCKRVWYW